MNKFFFLVALANGEHNHKVRNVYFVRRDAFLTHSKHRNTSRLKKIQSLIEKKCQHSARKGSLITFKADVDNIYELVKGGHCVAARFEGWKLGERLMRLNQNEFSAVLRELECFCFDMQKADRSRQAHVGQVMLETQNRSDKKHNKSVITKEDLQAAVSVSSQFRKVG